MTDKEQIIINGVNVSKCKYLRGDYCDLHMENEFLCHCEDYPDCYYKQLQKEKFENLNNRQMVESAENLIYENSELYKNLKEKEQECDCYRKALEEIEEYIYTDCEYNDGCDRNICIRCKYSNVHDKKILDIINKAKGCI